jgi:hypothetical protein
LPCASGKQFKTAEPGGAGIQPAEASATGSSGANRRPAVRLLRLISWPYARKHLPRSVLVHAHGGTLDPSLRIRKAIQNRRAGGAGIQPAEASATGSSGANRRPAVRLLRLISWTDAPMHLSRSVLVHAHDGKLDPCLAHSESNSEPLSPVGQAFSLPRLLPQAHRARTGGPLCGSCG